MMSSGAQAASVQRRLLCCDHERRKKTGIDCREREMGSKPTHMFAQNLSRFAARIVIGMSKINACRCAVEKH